MGKSDKDVMMKAHGRRWTTKDEPCKMNSDGQHKCYLIIVVQDPDGTVRTKKHVFCRCYCKAITRYKKR